MMIDSTFITRCIATLEAALHRFNQTDEKDDEHDICRSAVIKEFEIILEQSGKLLKKRLRPFFHSHKSLDAMTFKDLFRYAGKVGLLSTSEVENWLNYRDNRNSLSHDYGIELAEKTLPLLPQFIVSAKKLASILETSDDS